MNPNTKTIVIYYLRLIWRHKHYFIGAFLLSVAAGLAIAYSLPKTYRSSATLLMDVAVPKSAIQSTFTEYAGERIKSISQRIMTTPNILGIIKAHDLYLASDSDTGQDELVEQFKGDTDIHILKSNVVDLDDKGSNGIAFIISFAYDNPKDAQIIASDLARLFIEQNDMERTQRATKVADFLTVEAEKLNSEIQAIDTRISAYKKEYKDNLPEQLQGNLSSLDRKEGELRDNEQHIRMAQERITFLTVELAKSREMLNTADTASPKVETPAMLRAKYLKLSAMYSPVHPDVIRVKRQLEALAPESGTHPPEPALRAQLAETRRQLESLGKQAYADTHPDKIRLKNQIAALERQLADSKTPSRPGTEAMETHDNPTYLAVETQYKTSQSELVALQNRAASLKLEIEALHQRILLAPEVEKGYMELTRERDHSVNKYNQLKEKLLDAKLVQTLEEEQHGQTLTLLEPPTAPTRPDKTARKKVAIGGLALGIFAGLGAVLLAEFMDPKIRGYMALAEITGLMPLVVIPYIESPEEVEAKLFKQRHRRKIALQVGAACVLLAAIVICLLAFPAMRDGIFLAEIL